MTEAAGRPENKRIAKIPAVPTSDARIPRRWREARFGQPTAAVVAGANSCLSGRIPPSRRTKLGWGRSSISKRMLAWEDPSLHLFMEPGALLVDPAMRSPAGDAYCSPQKYRQVKVPMNTSPPKLSRSKRLRPVFSLSRHTQIQVPGSASPLRRPSHRIRKFATRLLLLGRGVELRLLDELTGPLL